MRTLPLGSVIYHLVANPIMARFPMLVTTNPSLRAATSGATRRTLSNPLMSSGANMLKATSEAGLRPILKRDADCPEDGTLQTSRSNVTNNHHSLFIVFLIQNSGSLKQLG